MQNYPVNYYLFKKKIQEYHHICKQLEADQADNKKLLITYADCMEGDQD